MTLRSVPIPKGTACADTSFKLSFSEAKALWAAGERVLIRYVFFGPPRPGDVDKAELDMLLSIGFIVVLVQHVRSAEQGLSGWIATSDRGHADSGWATTNAIACGYITPAGDPLLSLCVDLEDIVRGGPDFASAWCGDMVKYGPVAYVGFASGQSTTTLDALPNTPKFWADYAPLPMRPTPSRGWDMHQQAQTTVAGIGIDRDTVLTDGTIYGLVDADVNVETVDPRELPTVPLPFHVAPTDPPPPMDPDGTLKPS